MGIDHRLSTAYHPQTNGQTERTNQTVEQYLRHYINYEQNDWAHFLPMAQFAYNNAMHATTKETPFFTNYGYNPTLIGEPFNKQQIANQADNTVETIRQLHAQLSKDIDFMNIRTARYYNENHQEGPDLKKGEKAFLLQKNIKTKRPSRKLDHPKLGPFIIEEKLGPVNYRLRLPDSMRRIHPVFHISLLEQAPKDATPAEDIEIEDETGEYEVEQILDMQRINNQPFYLIKWKGYDTSENTWEPIENLTNCQLLIQTYHRQSIAAHPQGQGVDLESTESE
jgi:hypothetical protein